MIVSTSQNKIAPNYINVKKSFYFQVKIHKIKAIILIMLFSIGRILPQENDNFLFKLNSFLISYSRGLMTQKEKSLRQIRFV